MDPKNISHFLSLLSTGATILDYGSYDQAFLHHCQSTQRDCHVDACDIRQPEDLTGFRRFIRLDPGSAILPMGDASYDGIVLSHVLEHLPTPIAAIREILRILKPGGLLYIETPSERALHTRSHGNYARHGFFSFWDDPTHLRPWTPAALYRLAIGFECRIEASDYIGTLWDTMLYPAHWLLGTVSGDHHRWTDALWRAKKFSCYALVRRPETLANVPDFTYHTFRKP